MVLQQRDSSLQILLTNPLVIPNTILNSFSIFMSWSCSVFLLLIIYLE